MKTIVDCFGEKVRPNETLMARDGGHYEVTDLCPDDEVFQIGAMFEGGCADDDGDYFPAEFFFCRVIEHQKEPDIGDWRQQAYNTWVE